jgi:hypothetical protein
MLNNVRVRRQARPRSRRFLSAAASAACVAALVPAGASADDGTTAAGSYCDEPVTQPFTPWGDLNDYALAPGGDFEGSTDGWTFSDGAAIVSGSETYAATGTLGERSALVPEGGQVESAPVCVDETRESFRFFVRNASSERARIKVEVLFTKRNGRDKEAKVAWVTAPRNGEWQPTDVLQNKAIKALGQDGGTAFVTYRFTTDRGSLQIDDLFIDPWRQR